MEQELLDKVRKLLALSTSSNEHEAALAAAKAQELVLKYNLDLSMLGKGRVDEKEETVLHDYQTLEEVLDSRTEWTARLAFAVAKGNLCDLVITGYNSGFCWIGKKSNIEIAQYIYSFFKFELERIATEKWLQVLELKKLQKSNPTYQIISLSLQGISESKWKVSFYLGAVKGIREKMEGEKKQLLLNSPNLSALVVYNDNAVDKYKNTMFPNLTSMRSTTNIYQQAFNSGHNAGKNLSSNRGVNAGGTYATKQLGKG